MNKPLDGLGSYIKHPHVAALCDLSKRAYERFHEARGGLDRDGGSPEGFITDRFMYLAETTSTAIRLNVSWELTFPAMSLTRDRYEQTVRFGWLARQSDERELVKFRSSLLAKMNKIARGISPMAHKLAENSGKADFWAFEELRKEQRELLSQWESL